MQFLSLALVLSTVSPLLSAAPITRRYDLLHGLGPVPVDVPDLPFTPGRQWSGPSQYDNYYSYPQYYEYYPPSNTYGYYYKPSGTAYPTSYPTGTSGPHPTGGFQSGGGDVIFNRRNARTQYNAPAKPMPVVAARQPEKPHGAVVAPRATPAPWFAA